MKLYFHNFFLNVDPIFTLISNYLVPTHTYIVNNWMKLHYNAKQWFMKFNNYLRVNYYDNNRAEGSWDYDGAYHVYWLIDLKDLFSSYAIIELKSVYTIWTYIVFHKFFTFISHFDLRFKLLLYTISFSDVRWQSFFMSLAPSFHQLSYAISFPKAH